MSAVIRSASDRDPTEAAVVNALSRLTGKRYRRLPLTSL
jgi:hypothetical protein